MTKIAIVEDDTVIAQMYRMKFEADGFDVQIADNGADGVKLIEQMQPDMILMDLQMPVMDGVEAVQEIRRHQWGKHIPIFILTNLGQDEAPRSLHAMGIKQYIVKADFTPRQVVAKVKQELGISE